MFTRNQILIDAENHSLFLWGARQTGKSTLLKALFPNALWFDLLQSDLYERLSKNPAILRETILAKTESETVIIDEIQRIPELLNEVHWLMTNERKKFVLSGSSARKILRGGYNLLGGRALRYELYPLVSSEIPDFDLVRALNNGLLPRHYLATNAKKLLSAYIGNYLKDEIAAEAKIRNIQSFSKFLEAAAFSNGEMVTYANIATDCGVSAPTVKEYFQILEDTLIGRFVQAYQKKPKRRVITAPKFYFFDVGIVNHLLKRGKIEFGTEIFGNAFEHFIYHEIYAHSQYSGLEYPISYWRTASQIEVDFILGDNEVAVEVKSTTNVSSRHLSGLKQFAEEYKTKHLILVCNEPMPRLIDNILVLPWKDFLQKLWANELMN
jgi:predicted AAA+ superfamily ATPase